MPRLRSCEKFGRSLVHSAAAAYCFENSRVNPLIRPASTGHPLPQGGEGPIDRLRALPSASLRTGGEPFDPAHGSTLLTVPERSRSVVWLFHGGCEKTAPHHPKKGRDA